MPWEDRVRQGEYVSPEGNQFSFEFNELVREVAKKVAEKQLPGFDGDNIEDLGNRSVNFPLNLFFSGLDYDLVADRFWESLRETGPGTLKHPRWGDLNVLPISMKQTENLVTGARRATFLVTFKIVPQIVFPVSNQQAENGIETDLSDADNASADSFGSEINLATIEDTNNSRDFFTQVAIVLDDALRPLIESTESVLTAFDTTLNTIQTSIDDLLAEPVLLAQNYIRLTKLPARANTSIQAKINGYNAIFTTLFNSESSLNSEVNTYSTNQLRNHFISQEMLGFAIVGGLISSSLNTEYSSQFLENASIITSTDDLLQAENTVFTKAQVLVIVDELIATFAALVAALDAREEQFETELLSNQYIYSAEVLSFVKNANNSTTSLLINQAFTLSIEKIITLAVDRTPLDLCFELYKTIDLLDFFISSNNLVNSSILLIPKGTEILYYE